MGSSDVYQQISISSYSEFPWHDSGEAHFCCCQTCYKNSPTILTDCALVKKFTVHF